MTGAIVLYPMTVAYKNKLNAASGVGRFFFGLYGPICDILGVY